jgi:hypothetical protein
VTELPSIEFVDGVARARGSSPTLLRELLELLDRELGAAGVAVEAAFNPGLPRDAVEKALHSAGLAVPEEVVVWFGWHNGAADGPGQPIPNFYPVPLTAALSIHTIWDQAPEGEDPDAWALFAGKGWLRLGADNFSVAVDCRTADDPPLIRQPTYDFDLASGRHQAVSLCTWVTWRILGLRNGAYGRFPLEPAASDYDPSLLDTSQLRADFN